jgi:glycogen debranching enzyme
MAEPDAPNPQRRRLGKEPIEKTDPFYILATSPLADELGRVLKQGETFAVFDHFGDFKPVGLCEEGLYHEGTRFLSCLLLQLNKDRPLFLSSTVKQDNDQLAVDLTNPDVRHDGELLIPRGTLHIARIKFLLHAVCYECLTLRNYGLQPVRCSLALTFASDFADIFEVRGAKRPERGRHLDTVMDKDSVLLRYEGRDGALRQTRLNFAPAPASLSEEQARFDVDLQPKAEAVFYLTVSCETVKLAPASAASAPPLHNGVLANHSYAESLTQLEEMLRDLGARNAIVASSSEPFNAWWNRSLIDLHMMTTDLASTGPYPFAGVPWFSTVFGRDGIITAMECLWFYPDLARGVLAYLAETQATEVVPEQDAEPGKIIHETRKGEMAALGEVPFGRYYGSVDSTPLFILLAAGYYERTADRALLEKLWPHLQRALQWIDAYGDADGDGFVEYARRSAKGLVHQGWKDSHDGVFHADGALAEGAIALCEVQGYVYAAKRSAASLADVLGHKEFAADLWKQAQTLQQSFETAYWCEEKSTYALALDGAKQPCRVRTSNAGQCLFTGIATPEHARRVADALFGAEFFSGWGIRTVATTEIRYNPMSYHNGSVWPHDNALIAAGMASYDMKSAALGVLTALFEASRFVDLHRLPELYCGFARRAGEGPTLYPVACAPQSWSAAAGFLVLQACLGLRVSGREKRIIFHQPILPEFLKEVRIGNLRVGEASVELLLQRHGQSVGINLIDKKGDVEVVVSV